MLEGVNLPQIAEWVLHHHERPDGRGYPRGLEGDEVPLEARILSVADAYEAMTHDRVYRPALGPGAAWRELEQGAGSQFDEEVVEAFLRVLRAEGGARSPRPVDLRPRLEQVAPKLARHWGGGWRTMPGGKRASGAPS